MTLWFSLKKNELNDILTLMDAFLRLSLRLELHPDKVSIRTLGSGIDFLGWVHFLDHRVLRAVTKRRMLRRVRETEGKEEAIASYLGMLRWGNGHHLKQVLLRAF